MILLPPCVPIVASSKRIWIHAAIHPSKIAARTLRSSWHRKAGLKSEQEHRARGLICAAYSSMPDKSMCQHLFLCCQFFMVFDDISPIVSPTHTRPVASCQLPSCWPLLGPCVPIWLNRTCTSDAGQWPQLLCWPSVVSAFCLSLERCSLAFYHKKYGSLRLPDHCFTDETFRAMRGICSRCKTAATGSISVANVSSSTSRAPLPKPKNTDQRPMHPNPTHIWLFFEYPNVWM